MTTTITCLPASLGRQNMIDLDAHEAPQFFLDLGTLPEGKDIGPTELLQPALWTHQSKFFTKHSLIRVLGCNRSFDLMFAVANVDSAKGYAQLEQCSLGKLPDAAMMSARKAHLAAVHVVAAKAREQGPKWIPKIVGAEGTRSMKILTLPGTDLKVDIGGMHSRRFMAIIEEKVEFADLFPSTFWHHHQESLQPNDIIRVRRRDGAFDCELTVTAKAENGALTIAPWPCYPADKAAAGQASAEPSVEAPLQVVPIKDGQPTARVQFLPATKWRVMGWDGGEVSRDHETEAKAREAFAKYLSDLRMRMPTEEELAAARAETESKKGRRNEAH